MFSLFVFVLQATGSRVSSIVASLSTIIASTVFALFYGWKLALVVLSCVPFLAVANAVKTKVMVQGSMSGKGEDKNIQSGKVRRPLFILPLIYVISRKCLFLIYGSTLVGRIEPIIMAFVLKQIATGVAGILVESPRKNSTRLYTP